MNINEYKAAVIKLFQSGTVDGKLWDEMAECVLQRSENESSETEAIDAEVFGKCLGCSWILYEGKCNNLSCELCESE